MRWGERALSDIPLENKQNKNRLLRTGILKPIYQLQLLLFSKFLNISNDTSLGPHTHTHTKLPPPTPTPQNMNYPSMVQNIKRGFEHNRCKLASFSHFQSPVGNEFNVISRLSVVKWSILPAGPTDGWDSCLLQHRRTNSTEDRQKKGKRPILLSH